MVKAGQDLMEPRNLSIVALILVFGFGGMSFAAGEFTLKGIGLAGLLGVFLTLYCPEQKKNSLPKIRSTLWQCWSFQIKKRPGYLL